MTPRVRLKASHIPKTKNLKSKWVSCCKELVDLVWWLGSAVECHGSSCVEALVLLFRGQPIAFVLCNDLSST